MHAKPGEGHRGDKTVFRRLLYLGIAAGILVFFSFIPIPAGDLSVAGRMALGILVASVFLWVTAPIPMGVTALVAMVIMPVFGVLDYTDVWASWVSGVIFFVLASFAITAALSHTRIPTKIVFFLTRFAKGRSSLIVLAFMVACACCSAFINDLPTTAIFAGLAMSSIISAGEGELKGSSLAKCLMIGVSFASMAGGMSTPIGTTMNIMAMALLESLTGISLGFLDWVIIALPISIVMLFVSWYVLIKVFKPEPMGEEVLQSLESNAKSVGKLDAKDKKMLLVLAIMIVCWISNPWTGWDPTAICVAGAVLLFFPAIDLLTWDEFVNGVSWHILLVIGGVQSVAAGMTKQEASSWLVSGVLSKAALGSTALVFGAAVFIPLLRLVIPVAPALIAITMIPLIGVAQEIGVSPVLITILIALEANTYLLALDNNVMMSYRYGCYSIGDYFKAGVIPTIALILLCSTVLPMLVGFTGY